MTNITKDLPSNIILKDPNNPLSAVGDNGKGVYKYSYNPKTGRLLYSYPGEGHVNAIERAVALPSLAEILTIAAVNVVLPARF